MLEPGKLDKGIAGAEHQRHTYCVAEKGRLWRHIALQAQPDIAQTAESSSASSVSVLRQARWFAPIQWWPAEHR